MAACVCANRSDMTVFSVLKIARLRTNASLSVGTGVALVGAAVVYRLGNLDTG
jgi:hypothetical protein